MRQFSLILLGVLLHTVVFAQDFKLFSPGREQLFRTTGDLFYMLHIDSVKVQNPGESRYYNYKYGHDIFDTLRFCDNLSTDSWLGKYAVSKANGSYLFYNKEGDSLLIHTDTTYGVWRFGTLTGQNFAEAFFDKSQSNDTLLVIGFQAKSKMGDPIDHPVNKEQIIIGKQNGFLRTIDFYSFPEKCYSLVLSGSTDPAEGLTDFRSDEIYDYEVGDIFHRKQEDIFYSLFVPCCRLSFRNLSPTAHLC